MIPARDTYMYYVVYDMEWASEKHGLRYRGGGAGGRRNISCSSPTFALALFAIATRGQQSITKSLYRQL